MGLNKKTLLWLDDCRNPFKNDREWLTFSPIGKNVNLIWCKSFDEFTEFILNKGLPEAICFDHDLGEDNGIEKTGYDAAKWLVNYCMETNKDLPLWYSQSANPTGRDNINKYLENYQKFSQN